MYLSIIGPKDEAEDLIKRILSVAPDVIRVETEHHAEGVHIRCNVAEANQAIVGGAIQDHQIVEYCRTWRSKAMVARYFGVGFEAAEEILNRLTESGTLARTLDDSGRKREYRYMFIDSKKVEKCATCAYCFGTVDFCGAEDDWGTSPHSDVCTSWKEKPRRDKE